MDLYIREEWKAPAVVGVLSFAAGLGVGYYVRAKREKVIVTRVEEVVDINVDVEGPTDEESRNQLALDFARAAREQVGQPVRIKDLRDVTGSVVSSEEAAQNAARVFELRRSQPEPDPEPEMNLEPVEEDWDQAEEEANRGPNAPYVLHREEYFANETGFDQVALEYFAGDDVLCGEDRQPLYNHTKLVGRLEFGRGSGDPDVVYIRNEEERGEYEVTRNHSSYHAEVLGMEIEEEYEQQDLKHSNTPRRFRDD